ncbi:Tad domain-containing protein [Oceanobacillus salinisoli]|uniref:Tad domain-containing protein n=1 Tax=Oceanobacillus salinisoli TaxID=2678611 RepID=UPI0012E1572D|nr:Tad domain-containing protein [Oceanobacillus salinisoli]
MNKRLLKKEEGSVLFLGSLAFSALLAITGVVIDGGILYMTKADLQKTANAAALSGAQELTASQESAVTSIVDEILLRHQEKQSLESVEVILYDRVKVELKKTVPLAFSKLFGIDTVDIHANATAKIGVMGRATGAAPLGVDENLNLVYGEMYQLKVSSGDSTSGNFGILALEGKGAKTYEQTFREGYSEELKVGDTVAVQTGNIAGSTREVVKEKVSSACDIDDRECPRIIMVLVYKPVCADPDSCTNYQQVEITGFAYFYITEPMSDKDTAITGKFIKRTGTGYVDGNAKDRGAYSIQLTE